MSQSVYKATCPVSGLPGLAALAGHLARHLKPGDVVSLNGPLGAGKTTLVQYIGESMGLRERPVSPTFVLIHEYTTGRVPLVHADLYRLGEAQAESLADELLDTVQGKQAILFVEWADFGPFLDPYITLRVDITLDSQSDRREFKLEASRAELVEGLGA